MKKNHSVIIAFSLFVLLVAAVTANNIFINNIGNDLGKIRAALPATLTFENAEEIHKSANRMRDYWEKKRKWVSLSVAESELDNLSGQIGTLICAVEADDDTEYRKALMLFDIALDDICRLERFSIENIF